MAPYVGRAWPPLGDRYGPGVWQSESAIEWELLRRDGRELSGLKSQFKRTEGDGLDREDNP
jgi:hypothetical protein